MSTNARSIQFFSRTSSPSTPLVASCSVPSSNPASRRDLRITLRATLLSSTTRIFRATLLLLLKCCFPTERVEPHQPAADFQVQGPRRLAPHVFRIQQQLMLPEGLLQHQ